MSRGKKGETNTCALPKDTEKDVLRYSPPLSGSVFPLSASSDALILRQHGNAMTKEHQRDFDHRQVQWTLADLGLKEATVFKDPLF